MNNPIKVSIVLPSLNVRPYIEECVESAINQTLKEIEIICVDAGSTDGTLEILKDYEKKDKRVKVIISDVKSYGHQVNLGFDAAVGEYMAILETDDCVKPDRYEVLYNIAKKTDTDIIKTDFESFVNTEKGREYSYFAQFNDKSQYNKVFTPIYNPDSFSSNPSTWSSIYKYSFLKENNIRHNETPGASYQDTSFWFLTLAMAKKVCYLDKAFYMLRRDREESSVFNSGKVNAVFEEYDYVNKKLPDEIKNDENFKKIYWKKKLDHFIFHYNRISDAQKIFFLCRMSENFKNSYEKNEINVSIINETRKKDLDDIINRPGEFYIRFNNPYTQQIKKEKEELKKELQNIKKENEMIKRQHNCLINSFSYKIGRKITFIPKKLYDVIKCLIKNGFKYYN